MPKKREPQIIYGARCKNLADLDRAVDDMKSRAARESAQVADVEFDVYVTLVETADGFQVEFNEED